MGAVKQVTVSQQLLWSFGGRNNCSARREAVVDVTSNPDNDLAEVAVRLREGVQQDIDNQLQEAGFSPAFAHLRESPLFKVWSRFSPDPEEPRTVILLYAPVDIDDTQLTRHGFSVMRSGLTKVGWGYDEQWVDCALGSGFEVHHAQRIAQYLADHQLNSAYGYCAGAYMSTAPDLDALIREVRETAASHIAVMCHFRIKPTDQGGQMPPTIKPVVLTSPEAIEAMVDGDGCPVVLAIYHSSAAARKAVAAEMDSVGHDMLTSTLETLGLEPDPVEEPAPAEPPAEEAPAPTDGTAGAGLPKE
jgi:hypothetical protein